MSKTTDIWQTGIVHRHIDAILRNGFEDADITWLPEPGSFRFNADPFGVWHGDSLTVFVEAYDYRDKHGEIHAYCYEAGRFLSARHVAIKQPFHLSYPQILQDDGDAFLLPEGHKSGKLTLYRPERFPDKWVPVADLLEVPAIDASVVQHGGLWWMFYALPGPDQRAMSELHVAFADRLLGPWQPHSGNPVRTGSDSSRPGGTPFVHEGTLYLPVQDCSATYGGALKILRVDELTTDRVATNIARSLASPNSHYPDGLHTLSAAGDVTLIDVKRLDRSSRLCVDLERKWRRITGH